MKNYVYMVENDWSIEEESDIEIQLYQNYSDALACFNHELVMLWDGHKFDKDVVTSAVDRGYTTYSEEYFFKEAEKINYDL